MSVPKFALFGHPVAHTLSPRIHTAFARELGIPMEYKAIDVQPEHLAAALDRFAESGGVGGNVTLPFKEQAAALCVDLSPRAKIAGAVNTLQRTDQGWHGDNTDGAGLVRDLTDRHRLDLRGRRCLLLGAGGAGRGVAPALLDAGVSALVVVNRTPAKADSLIDALGDPAHATSRYWADLGNLGEFELIINATSCARQGEKLDLPFRLAAPRFVAVDLNYGLVPVSFLAWARAAKAEAAIDGLGMLVEQAAEAFALWHGKRPHTSDIYALLHQESKALRNAN